MRLGIIGAVALALGVWALASWWWFVAEIIEAFVAVGLIIGGALAIAISARRLYRSKQTEE